MKFSDNILKQAIDNMPISVYSIKGDIRIVITGSFLLCCHGLMDEFEDIDILVVNAGSEFWSDLYQNDYRYETKRYNGCDSVKVNCGGFTYNLISDDEYMNRDLRIYLDDDIEFDSLIHALQAKANLSREKDILHFKMIKERIDSIINDFNKQK